ncbi:flagellar hook-length control protein FliK, partial [Microbacterium sp. Cr-K20]
MTALGIVDMLDPRGSRPSGAAPSRGVTPGAAAFADVIQVAARAQLADDAPTEGVLAEGVSSGASTGTETTDATAESADPVVPVTASPLPPLTIPSGSGTAAPVDGSTSGADPDVDLVPPAADAAEGTGLADAPAEAAGPTPIAASGTAAASADPARAAASATALAASSLPPAVTGASSRASTGSGVGAASAPVGSDGIAGASGANSTTADAPVDTALRLVTAPAGPHGAVAAAASSEPAPASNADTALLSGTASAVDRASDAAPSPAVSAPVATATAASVPATADAAAPTSAVTAPAHASPPPIAPTTRAAAAAIARPVLLPQIAAPVVSLAQAADGDHSLTLTVSPENLGPVTVRAHISGGAIQIELHAPNELGREALRAVLADLRRDLAAAAPHASLMLSTSDDGPGSSNPQSSPSGG